MDSASPRVRDLEAGGGSLQEDAGERVLLASGAQGPAAAAEAAGRLRAPLPSPPLGCGGTGLAVQPEAPPKYRNQFYLGLAIVEHKKTLRRHRLALA